MIITRREFLKYCGMAAGALGLSSLELDQLASAMASPTAPKVVWFHGSGCQGDSISMLNRIAPGDPGSTVDDVLMNVIDLRYHAVVMTLSGEPAAVAAEKTLREGNFVLVVEGGIPTAFDGGACGLWTYNGKEVTLLEGVLEFAQHTSVILAVGTCAAYGGIPKAPPNTTAIMNVTELMAAHSITGKTIINIPGCPANPDWIVGTIAKFVLGQPIPLDIYGRPQDFYGDADTVMRIHDQCPRNENAPTFVDFATAFGQDHKCLLNLGCRGPETYADCPNRKWNHGVNWCVDANGMCIGCTQPTFPGGAIYEVGTLGNPGPLRASKKTR